jgi:hypothetical protein
LLPTLPQHPLAERPGLGAGLSYGELGAKDVAPGVGLVDLEAEDVGAHTHLTIKNVGLFDTLSGIGQYRRRFSPSKYS